MQFTGCQTRVMRYARRRKFSKEWSYCILPILCLDCRHFACANINLESKTLKYRTLPRQMTWRLIKIQWRIELFWQLAVSKFKLIDLKHQRSKSSISIFKPGSHNAGELPAILLPVSVGDICEQKAFTSAVRNNSCHQGRREDLRGMCSFFFGGPMTSFLSNSITTK